MALAKCKSCGAPKAGFKYVTFRPPLYYPKTALICSSRGCKNPALIWLTEDEEEECELGKEVFELDAQRVKVRVR
jgi:hypothetical protein